MGSNDSPPPDIPIVQKLDNYIMRIERFDQANFGKIALESPDLRLDIRPSSDKICVMGPMNNVSPGQKVPLGEFVANSTGEINGGAFSGISDDPPGKLNCLEAYQNAPGTKQNILDAKAPINS